MPRTTLNIDAPILRDLRRLQKLEGKPLGRLVSELLAKALRDVRDDERRAPPFRWNAQRLEPRVDLADKEAIRAVLDRDERWASEADRG
jgi:hypothetical protein